MIYLAYGSNMHHGQLKERCPYSKIITKYLLEDFKLEFNKYLNIMPSKGSVVPTLIIELSESDEASLDLYEGVHKGLYTKEYLDLEINGEKTKVLYYKMTDKYRGGEQPTDTYYQTVYEAYKQNDFDLSYLEEAVSKTKRL